MTDNLETRRETILAAAEAIVLEEGYASLSFEKIAAATGVDAEQVKDLFPTGDVLGQAVLERYARLDMELFEEFSRRAHAEAKNPLDRVLVFIGYFNDFLDDLEKPFPGCVFASYTYSRGHFGPDTQKFIDRSLSAWAALFEEKFEELIRWRKPKVPVTAKELAEMITTTIEGGFIMTNAKNDARWTQRQAEQFQKYVQLLFGE